MQVAKTHEKVAWRLGLKDLSKTSPIEKFVCMRFQRGFSYKLTTSENIFYCCSIFNFDSTLYQNGIRFLNSVKNSWFPALSIFQSNIHPDFYPSLTVTAESIPMGIPTVKCLASNIFTRLYRRYFPSSTSSVKVNTIVAHTGAYRSNSVDFYIF